MEKKMLALDFGASSARAMLGWVENHTLVTEEIHRWDNIPIDYEGHLCWDIDRLFAEIRCALTKAHQAGGFDAVGIDTWGVDFGLLDCNGKLLQPPVHYRDKRTNGILDTVFQKISAQRLYEITGSQIMEINTAFQLFALHRQDPEIWSRARTALLMPDLFAYFLTGVCGAEYSICSTTQLMDCRTGQWSEEVRTALGLPQLFPPVTSSGVIRGRLSPQICASCGIPSVPVIAVAGHDTASAVAAVWQDAPDTAFLSSGTWSLLGIERDTPVTEERAYTLSFANEGGHGRKIHFLKNLTGLWLVQESRRQWEREGRLYSFAELEKWAEQSNCTSRIDTQDPELAVPGDIPRKIRMLCERTAQAIPQTPGDFVRCIYESLADTYAKTLNEIEQCTQMSIQGLHMVGGGSRGSLLPQLIANRTGRTVFAGPVEATVIGNLLVQMEALGIPKEGIHWQESIRTYQKLSD